VILKENKGINIPLRRLTLQSLRLKIKFAEIIGEYMITNEQIRDLSGRRDALRRYL
jgi:hypothetical protein